MFMPKKEVVKKATKKKVAKKKAAKKKVVAKVVKVTKKAPVKKRKPRKRGMYYIDRKALLQDVIDSKAKGEMNDALAAKLVLLTTKYARHPSFARYTYNEDMQGYARMMLVKSWSSFKPEKSDNPFSFYTQCIKNSFKQFLNMEKRHRDIRDELLVDNGLNPSYTYECNYQDRNTTQPLPGKVTIVKADGEFISLEE